MRELERCLTRKIYGADRKRDKKRTSHQDGKDNGIDVGTATDGKQSSSNVGVDSEVTRRDMMQNNDTMIRCKTRIIEDGLILLNRVITEKILFS